MYRMVWTEIKRHATHVYRTVSIYSGVVSICPIFTQMKQSILIFLNQVSEIEAF